MTKLEEEIKIAMFSKGEDFDAEVKAAAEVARKYIESAMKYAASTTLDKKVYSSMDSYAWLKHNGVI